MVEIFVRRFVGGAGLMLALLACSDSKGLSEGSALPSAAPQEGATIYLEYSPGRPDPGDTVRVTLRAFTGPDRPQVGSFTGLLSYPSWSLQFIDAETGVAELRAAHPVGASVRVAGAALAGFPDGRLVRLRFLARTENPIQRLSLSLQELSGADLSDLLEQSSVSDLVVATSSGD